MSTSPGQPDRPAPRRVQREPLATVPSPEVVRQQNGTPTSASSPAFVGQSRGTGSVGESVQQVSASGSGGRAAYQTGSLAPGQPQPGRHANRDEPLRPPPQNVQVSDEPSPPRKARLQLSQVDPWSFTKVGFLLSIAFAVIVVTAIGLLWWVLSSAGVFDSLVTTFDKVVGQTTFDLASALSFKRVMGVVLILAVIEIILVTAFAALLALMFNLSTSLGGGLVLVLAEDD